MKEKIKQILCEVFYILIAALIAITIILICLVFQNKLDEHKSNNSQNCREASKTALNVETTTLQDLDTDFWYEQTAGIMGYGISFSVIGDTMYFYENGFIRFEPNLRSADELLFYLRYTINPTDFTNTIERHLEPLENATYSVQPVYILTNTFVYCSITQNENNYLILDVPIYKLDLTFSYANYSLVDVYNLYTSGLSIGFYYSYYSFNEGFSDNFNVSYHIVNSDGWASTMVGAEEIDQLGQATMWYYYFKYRNIGDIYRDGVADGNDQGFDLGYESGQTDILSNPNNYDLYNQTQFDNAIRDAYNNGVIAGGTDPLEKVWQIISNAGNAVAGVFNIQILPGITLGTLFGVFIGVPLLIYVLLLLRG